MKKIILTFILSLTTAVIFAQKKHTFKLGVVGLLKKTTGWVEYTDSEVKIHYDNPVSDLIIPVTKKIENENNVVFYTNDSYKQSDDSIRFKFIYTPQQKLMSMDTKDNFTGAVSNIMYYLD